jgi:lipid A ethanolaminephosphotransferase
VFRPVCQSVELSQCTPESLVNAYDNTILYNDHVVGRAISLLKGLGNVSSTLMYISDHGESLGEHGLFLHGTPLAIAPDVQKKIPFLVWTSNAFNLSHHVDKASLATGESHSQANIFHSVMGAFDMRSSIYVPSLDIYSTPSVFPGRQ